MARSLRTTVSVREVRGHVVRSWSKDTKERRGFSAVETYVTRYLLDDGRLVEQGWAAGSETPDLHVLVASAERAERVVTEMQAGWTETPLDVIGGRAF